MPRVTVIDAIIPKLEADMLISQKKRVAAYARVSTEQDEQQSSYEAQVDFYTRYINNNPDWEFVEIYSDEGITGTNTKKREGFNRMVADAKAGKIDLILTKSISRFARNTVDTLQTVRELKDHGVEVYFEKENIYTLDAKGEVLITIMSSLAQEESRSISENVRWGIQKSMQDGNVRLAYKNFLGYRKGPDGRPEIVPEEAEIIKDIYKRFLDGQTIRNIARDLTALGIPTPAGKTNWSVSTIRSILTNEKYKGDSLSQKTYTTDFLTKKIKKNNGEVTQYFVKDSHPAIITRQQFDLVQHELQRRSKYSRALSNNSPLTTKLICEDCGGFYGHKVHHGVDVWYCNHRYSEDKVCTTPILKETEIKDAFLSALNKILRHKAAYLAVCAQKIKKPGDLAAFEKKRDKAEEGLQSAIKELQDIISDNARRTQDQTIFRKRHAELMAEVEKRQAEAAKALSDAQAANDKVNFELKKIEIEQNTRVQVATNVATVMAEVGKNAKFYDFGGGSKPEGGGDLLTGILGRIPQIFAKADMQNQALNGEEVTDTVKRLISAIADPIKGQGSVPEVEASAEATETVASVEAPQE